MVGERGFEPPTPWSRTRCSTRLSHSPTLCGGAERASELPHPDYNIRLSRPCSPLLTVACAVLPAPYPAHTAVRSPLSVLALFKTNLCRLCETCRASTIACYKS